MRRYVTIQPGPVDSAADSESTLDDPLVKRRRVGVSIACNGCRRRKIRCDGQRPTCSSCEGGAEACSYRDDTQLSSESQLLLVDVVRVLNSIPDAEIIKRIRTIRKEIDTTVILSILGQGGDFSKPPSSESYPFASLGGCSFQTVELSSQNPNAYPQLPAFDSEILQEPKYQQLARPSSEPLKAPSSSTNPAALCDPRLGQLEINNWTNVPVASELAARAISAYLETDHPILGFFDPDLFVSDLVNGNTNYCSSLLVNSLLYWAFMYTSSTQETHDSSLALRFCEEAEAIWSKEKSQDSVLNLIAAQFLCLGYIGQGTDHAVPSYLRAASSMAVRLGLFGVKDSRALKELGSLSTEQETAYVYAAWGSFNWAVYMSLFYRQPDIPCPEFPPILAIPRSPSEPKTAELDKRMELVFPELCQFWSIMHDIALLYAKRKRRRLTADKRTLRFAEYKFRELLAWSNRLPTQLSRDNQSSHSVLVLHIWFHAAVLDLFRHIAFGPLRHHRLRTFTSFESSAFKVYEASAYQLKHLTVNYRLNVASGPFSILWHVALTYLANAVLQLPKEQNSQFYLMLCILGYQQLGQRWRAAGEISKIFVWLALRNGRISSSTAREIITNNDFNAHFSAESGYDNVTATFLVGLDLEEELELGSANTGNLAESLEGHSPLPTGTNVFDQDDAVLD